MGVTAFTGPLPGPPRGLVDRLTVAIAYDSLPSLATLRPPPISHSFDPPPFEAMVAIGRRRESVIERYVAAPAHLSTPARGSCVIAHHHNHK